MALEHAALLTFLAFTVATACVLVLRTAWRRLMGADATYALWLAVPLAMVLPLLAPPMPAPYVTIASMLGDAAMPAAAVANALDNSLPWRAMGLAAWLLGATVCALACMAAQWRYNRAVRHATPCTPHQGFPVSIAARHDLGPAQVGMLRPRIVLPCDFDQRFSSREKELVLAHEATHARRRDAGWAALAHAAACFFWFHPLAWWALRAFRTDQELACDAVVMRHFPGARRAYAEALLKHHDLPAIPMGCAWTRHPLTERIAMLKNTPSRTRRTVASTALPFAVLGIVTAAWSTTPPAEAGKPIYQIRAKVAASGGNDADVTLCTHEGQAASVTPTSSDGKAPWHITFTVDPDTKKDMIRVAVASESDDGHRRIASRQVVAGKPGEPMAIRFSNQADPGLRTVEIVPSHGCPATEKKHP